MNAPARTFAAQAPVGDDPLLLGMIGPPGGGKTYSALRVGTGIKRVRGGDLVVLDTEGGRAKKYRRDFDFKWVPFDPPFRPSDFLAALTYWHEQGAAAIITDSMSDEHEGAPGGVLDWHDTELDRMAGDDWAKRERVTQAAWIKPKRDRIKMMNGLLRITTPLIFCFRAREKTKQMKNDRGKMEPVNIGWQPIAPAEIVGGLDLTCILPPRAEGVPIWKSDKAGEDFIIKLPNYLAPYIKDGQPMSEDMGEAFAKWARGGSPVSPPRHGEVAEPAASSSTPAQDGAADEIPAAATYVAQWITMIDAASNKTHAAQLAQKWNDEKSLRNLIEWPDDDTFTNLRKKLTGAIEMLRDEK